MADYNHRLEKTMSPPPDILVICYCVVAGENEELLGVDESPITQISWIAIDVSENEIVREGDYEIQGQDIEDKDKEKEKTENTEENDNALYLADAIMQFEEILQSLSGDEKIVRLVTENGLHLRQCLHPHAFDKDIELSDIFYKYYDLRRQYKFFTDSNTPFPTLQSIAEDMKIEENEDLFSTPKNKCRFCARVVNHLIAKGHKFMKINEIYRTLEPGITNGYVKDDTIARARGLPWQVSDVDVAEFFHGLNIERGGVALCLNQKGRRNGEALVRFSCSEHREMALRRHKHHLFGRYIEVYKGTAQEFLKIAKGPAVAMQAAENFLANGGEVIIRMRGLPFDATIQDIVSFFGESPKVYQGNDGVMLVSHPDGSSTGDAFVLFKTEPEGQIALKKHRENIGKRYVELFRSTRAELQQVLTMYNVGYQMINPLPGQVTPSNVPAVMADRALINQRLQALMNMSCLRMRGLPFSAGQKDILNFLSTHADYVVGSVHIIYNLQGRPSGEAFVQLQNPDYAHKCANDLHLKHMGERYIEVFQCSVQDMTWMLATSHANQLAAQHLSQLNSNNSKNNASNTNNNNNSTYHPNPPSPPVLSTTQPPPMNGLIATPPPPPPPPITTNGFLPQNISPIPIFTNQYPPVLSPLPACFLPPPHMQPTHRIPVTPGGAPLLQPVMGPPVFNPESIHFQVNQFGKVNGVAYIAFGSPEEAQRAIQEKQKLNNGNRYVEMFIAH